MVNGLENASLEETVLIVDDDQQLAGTLSLHLTKHGFRYQAVHSGEEALRLLDRISQYSAILLDLMMPGVGGNEVLKKFHEIDPDLPIIILSGQEKVSVAVDTLRQGAYEYLVKPVEPKTLALAVRHAAAHRRVSQELGRIRMEVRNSHLFDRLVGRSQPMHEVFRLAAKTFPNDISVLIQGESGSGKELIARAIHFKGLRADKPFVVVNCAAIPNELVESELFGHEKGSFTGATQQKIGKFELASGGTLFLDEIGELNLSVQAKLLRALQGREIDRVGGMRSIPVDVRFLCATKRNLEEEVSRGRFREDLFYRINAFPIHIPPLRERPEDIDLLAIHFLDKQRHHLGRNEVTGISRAALEALNRYDWPGNVRQLENVIGRAVVLTEGKTIELQHLPDQLRQLAPDVSGHEEGVHIDSVAASLEEFVPTSGHISAEDGGLAPFKTADDVLPFDEIRAWALRQAYNACGGNISLASKKLGLGRATLYRLLKKFNIVTFDEGLEAEDDEE